MIIMKMKNEHHFQQMKLVFLLSYPLNNLTASQVYLTTPTHTPGLGNAGLQKFSFDRLVTHYIVSELVE